MAFENGIGGTALSLAPDVPIYEAQQKGADAALAVQQDAAKRATLGVLANMDVNDPDSINKGMNSLLASGQAESAKALADLQFSRWQRQQGQQMLGPLQQVLANRARAAQGTTTVQTGPMLGQKGQSQDQSQMQAPDMAAFHRHIAGDFQAAAGISDPQQMDAFKQQMHQKYDGIVGADAVNQQLADEKTPADWLHKAAEHLGEAQNIEKQAQTASQSAPAASGQASAPQDASATPEAAVAAPAASDSTVAGTQGIVKTDPTKQLAPTGLDLNTAQTLLSPEIQAAIAAAKQYLGVDLSPITQVAKDTIAPAAAGATTMATAEAGNLTSGPANLENAKTGAQKTVANKNVATTEVANAPPGTYGSPSNVAKAVQSTAGTIVPVTVKDPNGVVHTEQMSGPDAQKAIRNGHVNGYGVDSTAQEKVSQQSDAEALAAVRKGMAEDPTLSDDKQKVMNGHQALSLLTSGTLNPNQGTPYAKKITDFINAATGGHMQASEANDYSTYERLANNNTANFFSIFPGRKTDTDIKFASGLGNNLQTLTQAAELVIAQSTAQQERALSFKTFVAQHPEIPSMSQALKQWSSDPANQQSLYANPIFQQVKQSNGLPVVQIDKKVYKDGHLYGTMWPGTPKAFTFLVQ